MNLENQDHECRKSTKCIYCVLRRWDNWKRRWPDQTRKEITPIKSAMKKPSYSVERDSSMANSTKTSGTGRPLITSYYYQYYSFSINRMIIILLNDKC